MISFISNFTYHFIQYHIQLQWGLIELGEGLTELGIGLRIINARRTVLARASALFSFQFQDLMLVRKFSTRTHLPCYCGMQATRTLSKTKSIDFHMKLYINSNVLRMRWLVSRHSTPCCIIFASSSSSSWLRFSSSNGPLRRPSFGQKTCVNTSAFIV